MVKKKHNWHCGICNTDCQVLKKGKGTKYIYCPICDKIYCYYNKGLIKKVGKGLLRSVPGGDVVAELITKEPKVKSETSKIQYIDSKDKPNYNERLINKVLYGV